MKVLTLLIYKGLLMSFSETVNDIVEAHLDQKGFNDPTLQRWALKVLAKCH